jgi:septal ring factor EnvC (AmiA/AmiB activator)
MELLHLVSIGLFVLLPVVADDDTFKGIKSTIASVENSLAGVRSRLSSLENKLKSKYSIFYHNFISSQSSSILV